MGNSGETILQAKERGKGKKKENSDKECFNCKKKGHISADCWTKGGVMILLHVVHLISFLSKFWKKSSILHQMPQLELLEYLVTTTGSTVHYLSQFQGNVVTKQGKNMLKSSKPPSMDLRSPNYGLFASCQMANLSVVKPSCISHSNTSSQEILTFTVTSRISNG